MRNKNVILIGAGGHALSLAEFAGEQICGYLALGEATDMPFNWLGGDDSARKLAEEGYLFHMAFVYAGLPTMDKREKLISLYRGAGAKFKSLIAPTAIVTPHSEIGEGVAVMQGAIVNRAKLGDNVILNSGGIVEHDCLIGENTFIGPGAVVGGFTTIGRNCFIGLGARVGNGINIGDNVTVAMGAVVNRDLTEPGIYHGPTLKRFTLPERRSQK